VIPEPSASPSNTQIILRNSLWYGLELFSGLLGAFLVQVIVARVIGPERLGYYTYINLLTTVTATVGAFGLPLTTRKYMAEYLNRGEIAIARSIYQAAWRLQFLIAGAITLIGLVLVFTIGDPNQRLISVLLVLNMGPRMLGFIPSQANNAAESLRSNTVPSVVSGLLTLSLTLLSLWAGWELPGIAAALLAGTVVDMGMKLRSVRSWLSMAVPAPLSPALRKQLLVYSGQGLVLMLINIVVWDRSDVFFLKNLNPDIKQVTFFAYAFNLVERLIIFPNAFTGPLGVTLMAQYGRDERKLRLMTVEGARYSFLIALPLLAGLACVAGPAVLLIYGEQFRPMIPVLTIVALLAIPKALIAAPTSLLQATENQGFLVTWGLVSGAVNIILDVLLTPRYGAMGAAIANGSTQTLAAVGIWLRAYSLFRMELRLKAFGRIALSGAGMAGTAMLISRGIPSSSYASLAAAILCGAVVWFVLLRWTDAVDQTDRQRLLTLGLFLPARVRPVWQVVVAWMGSGTKAALQ
jgi:O-antigen/teichoic acid export membrane protein